MAVYDAPSEITIPELDFSDIDAYNKACSKFEQDLKDWCIKRANKADADTTNIGEIIRFPVADGYALYMVAALKPIQLIHIPTWDAWEFQYANRLTKQDILDKIDQQKKLTKLFGG